MRLAAASGFLALALVLALSGGQVRAAEVRPPQLLSPAEVKAIEAYVGRSPDELAGNLRLWGALYRVLASFRGSAWAPYDRKRPLVSVFEERMKLLPFARRRPWAGPPGVGPYDFAIEMSEDRYVSGRTCSGVAHTPQCSDYGGFVIDVRTGHAAVTMFTLFDVKKKRWTHRPVMFIRSCAPPEFERFALKRFAVWHHPALEDDDLSFQIPFTVDVAKVFCGRALRRKS